MGRVSPADEKPVFSPFVFQPFLTIQQRRDLVPVFCLVGLLPRLSEAGPVMHERGVAQPFLPETIRDFVGEFFPDVSQVTERRGPA